MSERSKTPPPATAPVNALVGKWFHTSEKTEEVVWSGQVVDALHDRHYLVRLRGDFPGVGYQLRLVHFSSMQNWRYFEAAADMEVSLNRALVV